MADNTKKLDSCNDSVQSPVEYGDVKNDPGGTPVCEQVLASPAREIGGREGPDPTRYGDWEKNGRCIDF